MKAWHKTYQSGELTYIYAMYVHVYYVINAAIVRPIQGKKKHSKSHNDE